ncbi:MAG: hypothetical protein ACPGYY_07000, partial [Bacteroidia bacterium]
SFILFLSTLGFSQISVKETSPKVHFGNLKHPGPYDRSEILLQDRLTMSNSGTETYSILSFSLTISPTKGLKSTYEISDAKIPAKVQGSLNQIISGDTVLISDIKIVKNEDFVHPISIEEFSLLVATIIDENDPYNNDDHTNWKKDPYDNGTEVTLGLLDLKTATLEDIKSQTELLCDTSSNAANYIITSFKMIAAPKKGIPSMATSASNKLTDSMIRMLQPLNSGDVLLFEGIKAYIKVNGTIHKANLPPLLITLP